MVVVDWAAVTEIVPLAVTPGSGFSRKLSGVGDGGGLGEEAGAGAAGDVGAAAWPPQAAAHSVATASNDHILSTTGAGYWTTPRNPGFRWDPGWSGLGI
jgi:hypothetical protein